MVSKILPSGSKYHQTSNVFFFRLACISGKAWDFGSSTWYCSEISNVFDVLCPDSVLRPEV